MSAQRKLAFNFSPMPTAIPEPPSPAQLQRREFVRQLRVIRRALRAKYQAKGLMEHFSARWGAVAFQLKFALLVLETRDMKEDDLWKEYLRIATCRHFLEAAGFAIQLLAGRDLEDDARPHYLTHLRRIYLAKQDTLPKGFCLGDCCHLRAKRVMGQLKYLNE